MSDSQLANVPSFQLGKDADYFIYPSTTWDSVYEEKKDILDQIKAVQNQQVYDNQGPGPNAWHEQRLAEYDIVALDFCDVVGTASNTGTGELHKRVWLRNIYTEPIGSLPECRVPDEIDEPYVAKGAECSLLGEPSGSTPMEGENNGGGAGSGLESGTDSESADGSKGETVGVAWITSFATVFASLFLAM